MTPRTIAFLLLMVVSPIARAQFQLFVVNGSVEQAPGPVYPFGTLDTGDTATAHFRIRNTSAAVANLSLLSATGAGFTLTGPAVPLQLNSQAAIDFSVSFQGAAPGSYSGALDSVGISVLLTATALPRLTYQVNASAGTLTLGGSPVDFGGVTLGSSAKLRFTAWNQTAQSVTVPALSLTGADFAFSGPLPAGTLLPPLQTATFAIVFTPSVAGARSAILIAGTRTYTLTGGGQTPVLPTPSLKIDLPNAASAQQGRLSISLNAPAPVAASGVITLGFEPFTPGSADPAIAFSSGGRTASFTVTAGGTQAIFDNSPAIAFQTGTIAGTLTFELEFGGAIMRQTVNLPPSLIGVSAVQATRQSSALTVQVIGFDNTLTAGKLIFTFYDSAGNPIAPAGITADATSAFAGYFANSGLGGTFSLTAVFPVSGGVPSQVASFEAQLVNSAGATHTARTNF